MAWDKTQPANNAALLSPPIRANWDALDVALMAPLTALANGQVLYKASGVLAGVPAGTNGYILTLVGGVPLWQPAPTGVAFPLLAPDGSITAPSYSFANSPGTGLYCVTGAIALRSLGALGLLANGRVDSSWLVYTANEWMPGVDNTFDIGRVDFRPRDLFLGRLTDHTNLASAPATPAAGHTVTYAKTDKKMYAKDDAGVETPLGGSATPAMVPLSLDAARFPDGSAPSGNAFPQPIERVSTGTPPVNSPKFVELVYYFDANTIEHLIWKGVTPLDYVAAGAITLVAKFSMVSATTGNVRLLGSWQALVDSSTDVRATTGFQAASADMAVPATLGQQKEIRVSLNQAGSGPGMKFLVSLGLIMANVSSATGDRVLEAAWLEFAR